MNSKIMMALVVGLCAATGCSNGNGGNGNGGNGGTGGGGSGGSGGGVGGGGDGGVAADMTPTGDMTDVTPVPAPTSKHVGATGLTAGLVTDGNQHAAYLLNPALAKGAVTGELHVTDAAGNDVKVASGIYIGGYLLAPDGKSLVFSQYTAGAASASLSWLDLTTKGAAPKQVIASGIQVQPVDAQMDNAPLPLNLLSIMGTSGNFLVIGVMTLQASPDMHVIDLHKGTDVYQRGNGEYDYFQLLLPNDTLVFQDTANGTSTTSPPLQTLYWIALPSAASSSAATITTRVSQFLPTADNSKLVILKTSGDLQTWDLTKKSGAPATIAQGVAKLSLGLTPTGPIAYVGADRSVHVVTTDGTKLLDVPASAGADPFGAIMLSPDTADVYYFQNADTQNTRGTLMHVAVKAGATPGKVADNVSQKDVQILDGAIVFLQNVDAMGQFGDAAMAKRDGSSLKALGTKANVGGLLAVNPGPGTWFAMHLTGAATVMGSTPIDGTAAITGGLAWIDYSSAAEATLDPAVHAGTFAFSDDGRDVVFAGATSFGATASNFTGKLTFLATRAPKTAIDGGLAGVSEVGPIVSRSLFVNAPAATMAGVYFVKY